MNRDPSHHEVPSQFPGVFPASAPVRWPPSHWTYPFNFSTDIQLFLPFQGMTSRKTFSSKKSLIFAINRYLYGTKSLLVRRVSGATLGGLMGMDWGLFSLRKSSWQGRIQGAGQGRNQRYFSIKTPSEHDFPSNSRTFSLVSTPSGVSFAHDIPAHFPAQLSHFALSGDSFDWVFSIKKCLISA